MIWLIVCYGISANIEGGCKAVRQQQFRSEAACWKEAKKIDPDGFGKDAAYCTYRSPKVKKSNLGGYNG